MSLSLQSENMLPYLGLFKQFSSVFIWLQAEKLTCTEKAENLAFLSLIVGRIEGTDLVIKNLEPTAKRDDQICLLSGWV